MKKGLTLGVTLFGVPATAGKLNKGLQYFSIQLLMWGKRQFYIIKIYK